MAELLKGHIAAVTGGGSPEDSPNEARIPRGARHLSESSKVVRPIES